MAFAIAQTFWLIAKGFALAPYKGSLRSYSPCSAQEGLRVALCDPFQLLPRVRHVAEGQLA